MAKELPASTRSREAILRRLREVEVPNIALPEVTHGNWIGFENPVEQLASVIRSVGGECKSVASLEAVREDLTSYPEFQAATHVWSNVPSVPGNIDLNRIDNPHDLDNVDFTVYQSKIAVAENGAVWVTDQEVKHRVVFFIAQHLILIVERQNIVPHLHAAYELIEIPRPGFGCFISGPSKTADIEQSLVIGAHGCRSMQLYVIG